MIIFKYKLFSVYYILNSILLNHEISGNQQKNICFPSLGIVHKLRSRWGDPPPPRSRLRYDYGNGGVPPPNPTLNKTRPKKITVVDYVGGGGGEGGTPPPYRSRNVVDYVT